MTYRLNIETNHGIHYFDSILQHFINNYKIFYLLDYKIFFITNIYNKTINGFIIKQVITNNKKGYFYYNIIYNRIYYINDLNLDIKHHTCINDMNCKTYEILQKKKIENILQLLLP